MKKILLLSFIIFSILVNYGFSFSFEKIELQAPLSSDAVKEIGSALRFNQTSPAASLGILGFNAGVNIKMFNLTKDEWRNAIGDSTVPSMLITPQLVLSKGIIMGTDLEIMYMPVIGGSVGVGGAAVKFPLMSGSIVKPTIALRLAYSTLLQKTNFSYNNTDISLSISKGFPFITPYALVSMHNTKLKSSDLGFNKSEKCFEYGAGAKVSLGLFNIIGSIMLGEAQNYNLSFNIGI